MTASFHDEGHRSNDRQDDVTLDMTRDGDFVEPPRASIGEIALRLVGFALLLSIGVIAFWLAVFAIPVLIVLGLIGYLVFRLQMARHGVRVPPVIIMRRGR